MKTFLVIAIMALLGFGAFNATENDLEETAVQFEETIEEAANTAEDWLGVDADAELTYEDQLEIVKNAYRMRDEGKFEEDGLLDTFLDGYEKHVDDLNSYHALLDEVGVPGKSVYIDLH